ncbi:hydroxymethylbilane synthase [Sphingomonas cannabina]|uniref:hydroxymethylbilane synthase n=1 Tax=Sphingomonas cannabina TaxID=2899123 RepID=UPI001F013253|nr:hydroxymethylbilane synthase [Sphingomonas cannabina]UIJ45904.1 hydroxymethylbilane synthase [Sphingomonas cannabina]
MIRIRLGTRGSPLALVQAGQVRDALAAAHGCAVDIVPVRTTGDKVQDRALAEIGGKALWTKELDRALLAGEIDCAVHSMKDVETVRPPEIAIAAMLERADVRDRLVGAASFEALPEAARIGTSSPRRAAQVRRIRGDLRPVLFRGNVDTRLAKLAAGEAEATLLAAAGLARLGRDDIGVPIPLETMLPAPAQGAVGIEARAGDGAMLEMLAAIGHRDTEKCVHAERAVLAALHADCHSPVAVLARIGADGVAIDAELLAEDGSESVRLSGQDPDALAAALLAAAPAAIARLFGA